MNSRDIEDKLQINNLSLNSEDKNIYKFEGEDYKKFFLNGDDEGNGFGLDIGQRERKLINSNLEEKKKYILFKYLSKTEVKKIKILTGWKLKYGGGYSHQFFDNASLDYLESKEEKWKNYLQLKSENPEEAESIFKIILRTRRNSR